MIYEREVVITAVAREMVSRPGDSEGAKEAAARALGVPVEVVDEAFADAHDYRDDATGDLFA